MRHADRHATGPTTLSPLLTGTLALVALAAVAGEAAAQGGGIDVSQGLHPPLVPLPQRNRVEVVEPVSAPALDEHDSGVGQDPEMLHDREPAEFRDLPGQRAGGRRAVPEQAVHLVEEPSAVQFGMTWTMRAPITAAAMIQGSA